MTELPDALCTKKQWLPEYRWSRWLARTPTWMRYPVTRRFHMDMHTRIALHWYAIEMMLTQGD